MNILLTSVGRRNYIVDFFKEAVAPYGGKVFAVNSHENAPGLFCADSFLIAPSIHSEEYVPFLIDYCEQNAISVIVPLLDNDLPVLAAVKELFNQRGIYVLTPDLDTCKLSNDKFETYQFLKSIGFNTVPTFCDLISFKGALNNNEINFPVVVKPRWGMGSLSLYIAEDMEELEFYFKLAQKEVRNSFLRFESAAALGQEVLIMEKIEGDEYMIDIVNDLNGEFKLTVVNKKILRKGGETEVAETVVNPILEQLGQRISSIFRHPLVMDADVFLNDRGAFVLEFNPRFSGGYPFTHYAGVDLTKALVHWLRHEYDQAEKCLNLRVGSRSLKGIAIINAIYGVQMAASTYGQSVENTIL